jgi:hypothetical protein
VLRAVLLARKASIPKAKQELRVIRAKAGD